MRPTLEQMYMNMAFKAAERSTCQRLKVGCIITDWAMTGGQSTTAYNGTSRKLPNGCESLEPGKCNCCHAEINALVKAPYDAGPQVLFCTHAPCKMCAKYIINSSVKRVCYAQEYRSTEGIELLSHTDIAVVYSSEWACPTS